MQITSSTNNEIYDNLNRISSVEKAKSDDFENFIASQKSSAQSNTKTTIENKTEIVKEKDSTQKLYDDVISLLKTGFTKSELKAFEEKLKEILKMKKDAKPDDEIEAALKKLSLEIQEAKKRVTGQVVKESDENTNTTTPSNNSTFDTMVTDIGNMLQEIKDSSKNTATNDKDEESNKSYDKLKMLLKMS